MSKTINQQPIIPVNRQKDDASKRIVIGPCGESADQDSPRLKVIKRDDIIERLQITCSCGEIIQVDCRYKND